MTEINRCNSNNHLFTYLCTVHTNTHTHTIISIGSPRLTYFRTIASNDRTTTKYDDGKTEEEHRIKKLLVAPQTLTHILKPGGENIESVA